MVSERASQSILKKYYSHIQDLHSYLTHTLDPVYEPSAGLMGFSFKPNARDTTAYVELVNSALVGIRNESDLKRNKKIKAYETPPELSMLTIIDRALEKLLKSKQTGNLITAGYRLSSNQGDRGKQGMERLGVTNFFVNTIVTSLQNSEWETLLGRIGIDAMIHLLTETSIFVSLPNDCYCQMTGKSILYLTPIASECESKKCAPKKREAGTNHIDERPNKRVKIQIPEEGNDHVHHTTADIILVRLKMFYARPTYVPNTRRIAVGLPPRHFLNQIRPSFTRPLPADPNNYVDPDPMKQAEHARYSAKYVFPRQYGLLNPFHGPPHGKKYNIYRENIDREAEIRVDFALTPLAGPKC
ncbi:hypothetical protein AX17_007341 [Amanita inopinata Kibby_2008]|nr:hypothetical protein AX17_007341 [Amanita inopinata Kibby_2008]